MVTCTVFGGGCYGSQVCDELTTEAIGLDGTLLTPAAAPLLTDAAARSSGQSTIPFEDSLGAWVLRRSCDQSLGLITMSDGALSDLREATSRIVIS